MKTVDEERKKKIRAAQEKRIRFVCEKTGWDYDFAREKMIRSKKIAGSTFEYYAGFKLWEFSEKEQKTFFLKRDADIIVKKFNTKREYVRVAWNKQLFLRRFSDYLGRPWIDTTDMDLNLFSDTFGKEERIIYKPQSASAGAGIRVYNLRERSMQDVYQEISQLDAGVVEGFLHQHPEMQKLSLKGVNTIRVVTCCPEVPFTGLEAGKVHFAYMGVRMCQGDAYTDNAHQGGMVAGVDLETGKIVTDAFDYNNKIHKVHPDTGTVIRGFQIPYFEEMKAMISKAGLLLPGYFGWDIAISETGPVVIELNSHPGAEILQLPYVPERKGMRYVMERFIDAQPITQKTEKGQVKKEVNQELSMKKVNKSHEDDEVPDRPYGLKISDISKDGIEFYWKKLAISEGYEVYRGYSKEGPFEKIYDATRRNIGTYRDPSFDHSKKEVYYNVRSYIHNKAGEKVLSDMVTPACAYFITKLRLDRDVTYMYDGGIRKLKAIYGWGEPEDGVFSSSNEKIARVDQNGTITAVSAGECEILYTSASVGASATSRVVVNRKAEEVLHDFPVRFHRNDSGIWENPRTKKTGVACIMMAGDLMCGKTQMEAQSTPENGCDFTDSFRHVKEMTEEADFAVANLETLLAPGWPYMTDEVYIDNFNNCNASPRYLEAVRYGGFDAVVMSNNHNCDGGIRALMETIDQTDRYHFIRTGVFKNQSEDRFFIADVNCIRVGFLAYMSRDTGFNGKDATWTKDEKDTHLNIFTQEKAQKDITACRAAGAEYVIVYMHWGKKNFRKPTLRQKQEAVQVADAGADYIVGSNPHIVQLYEELVTEDGRCVPCFYSVGNFQTVMAQVKGNRDSVLVRILLKKDSTGKVVLAENNYIPCHAYRNIDGAKWAPTAVSDTYNKGLRKLQKEEYYKYITETIGSHIKAL